MNERSVLLVDGETAMLSFMRMVLEDAGYRVLTAPGREAVQVARVMQPAVILLDVPIPTVAGLTVAASLRDEPLTAHIPLVLMAAPDCLAALPPQLRINDLLSKPFHFGDLTATVARWTAAPAWDTAAVDREESGTSANHATGAAH